MALSFKAIHRDALRTVFTEYYVPGALSILVLYCPVVWLLQKLGLLSLTFQGVRSSPLPPLEKVHITWSEHSDREGVEL